jgi:predicted regulator of Ras-like GTPase activity (Roadblock/LC7/MglB family)
MFKDKLEAILQRTEGAIGALIMGIDGIAVEKVLSKEGRDANLDVVAAELTTLIRNSQRMGEDTGLGGLNELVLNLEGAYLAMRLISREYFIVLALQSDGNVGRGRFELRKAELELAREFAV